MRPENKKALEEYLAHADTVSDDVLYEIREMLGTMPFIMPVLRERPAYFALAATADQMVCRPEHLDPKTAELVAIAAAAGAGADSCLRVHLRAAVKEGAGRDEIYDTILIAALIARTKVLAATLRELSGAFPDNTGKGE
jgi:AhpD family alkylhydroperoxidase